MEDEVVSMLPKDLLYRINQMDVGWLYYYHCWLEQTSLREKHRGQLLRAFVWLWVEKQIVERVWSEAFQDLISLLRGAFEFALGFFQFDFYQFFGSAVLNNWFFA